MSKIVWISLLLVLAVAAGLFLKYWTRTQPVWIGQGVVDSTVRAAIPKRNLEIIEFVEMNGQRLAPSYEKVVCTEFVINTIEPFSLLNRDEKNAIRILTSDDLIQLIKNDSPIIKGVQTALKLRHKGTSIINSDDALPGDFVQFWNFYGEDAYGHCGVVLEVNPGQSLTLYSSHPLTGGFGKQKFEWPDKVFFVRLN